MRKLIPFIILIFAFSVSAQTELTEKSEAQANKLMTDAGIHFKAGLIALQDNLRSKAGENFDNSVEVFLLSTVDIQKNEKLNQCYTLLIETIYLIEFPFDKQPNITWLSDTCGWNIDNKLINDVAQNIKNFQNENKSASANTTTSVNNISQTNNLAGGFNTQPIGSSPLDDLAKLELTQEEQQIKTNPVRVVKAQSGDTVTSIAQRYGASVVEVAKFNGLLPSAKLPAGREIRIPTVTQTYQYIKPSVKVIKPDLGAKPTQAKDGKVQAVMSFINEYFNDPYSVRFVRWSKVEAKSYLNKMYWSVQVKFRAKNAFNAYVLSETIYYIKNNKVVAFEKLY